MNRLSHYNTISQPKVNTFDSSERRSPWGSDKFSLEPSRAELSEERDGASLRASTVVRFLKLPFFYQETWAPVQKRVKGVLQNYWTTKAFMRTENLPGFETSSANAVQVGKERLVKRDMITLYYKLKLEELRQKKEAGQEVTKDDWKNVFKLDIEKSMKQSLEVIDFAWYHWVVPPGGKYADLEVCAGRNCPLCKSSDPQTAVKRFGGRRHWPMTKTLWATLTDIDQDLARYVIAGDKVEEAQPGVNFIGMNCSSCGNTIISKEDLQGATPKQVRKWSNSLHTCSCGHEGYLKDVVFLTGACEIPAKRMTYMDCPWKIEWKGTKTSKKGNNGVTYHNTTGGKYTLTPLIDHATELVDAGDFGKLPQELATPEWQQTPETVGRPVDFEFKYRPEQKDVLGNWLSPQNFDHREDFVQEVLASQAAWLQIEVPEEWKKDPYGDLEESEIPF